MKATTFFSLLATTLISCGADFLRIGPVKVPLQQDATSTTPAFNFHELNAVDIHGKPYPMSQLEGHKVMVVNTASECGFTPQYKDLEALYEKYKDKGFIIVGFPSNDFGEQEPGDEKTIEHFCQANYGITFLMMSKVSTKGKEQHPVYQWLTQKDKNGKLNSEVKWNFQKYLINEDGTLFTVLASATKPMAPPIIDWLEGKK